MERLSASLIHRSNRDPTMASSLPSTKVLARAIAARPTTEEQAINAIAEIYCGGKKPRWLRPVIRETLGQIPHDRRPLLSEVEWIIDGSRVYQNAIDKGKVSIGHLYLGPAVEMFPSPWPVPPATNEAALAKILGLHIADVGWLLSRSPRTQHYHLCCHKKRSSARHRLIEIPKPLLKETQRTLYHKRGPRKTPNFIEPCLNSRYG